VRRADEILVVEHGRIVQRGTERALLAEEGPFRRLATTLHDDSLDEARLPATSAREAPAA
jgi:ABC-type transport system involved in cytochrome bd biosynthesis fused ATPase/permease subunit